MKWWPSLIIWGERTQLIAFCMYCFLFNSLRRRNLQALQAFDNVGFTRQESDGSQVPFSSSARSRRWTRHWLSSPRNNSLSNWSTAARAQAVLISNHDVRFAEHNHSFDNILFYIFRNVTQRMYSITRQYRNATSVNTRSVNLRYEKYWSLTNLSLRR